MFMNYFGIKPKNKIKQLYSLRFKLFVWNENFRFLFKMLTYIKAIKLLHTAAHKTFCKKIKKFLGEANQVQTKFLHQPQMKEILIAWYTENNKIYSMNVAAT